MEHAFGNTGLNGLDWLLLGSFLALALGFWAPGRWRKWRHQQTRRLWAIQRHSIEIEVQADGGYRMME